MTALVWVLAATLVVVGLIGILLPALPGTVLIFAGLFLAAWIDGFSRIGAGTLVLLAVLTAASYAVDLAAGAVGVERVGASRRAMIGAALGTVAGLFFGLAGLLVGPFAGAAIGELTASRDPRRALGTGVAAWLGFVLGMAVKVGVAFVMIGIFVAAYFLF